MISQPEQVELLCSEVAQEMDTIIDSATCIDRGVDPESGKRGKCHVFRGADICICGDIDLAKERLR